MKDSKGMVLYVIKRILLMIFSFLVILTICFFLIRLLPINMEAGPGKDPEIFKKILQAYGRDQPLLTQYGLFWKTLFYPFYTDENGVVQELSRFGYSWNIVYMGRPDQMLLERFPPTVIINVYSIIISIPIGIGLGVFMALHKNKWQDHLLSILIMVFISVPSFVYAFIVQYIFAYKLGWLPTIMPSLGVGQTWFSPDIQAGMIMPVLAMCFGSIAGFGRYTRAELTEVLTSDFMLLARTKGLTKGQATMRHAFRNSLVPIFPMILGEFISVLSGSVIIEKVFGIPGVGRIFLDSITMRDYDVFLFVGMFYTLIGLVGGLVVDLSYGIVDPRIRMGGGKQ